MREIWKEIKRRVSEKAESDGKIMEQVERMSEEEMDEFLKKYREGDPEARAQEKLAQAISVWKATRYSNGQ